MEWKGSEDNINRTTNCLYLALAVRITRRYGVERGLWLTRFWRATRPQQTVRVSVYRWQHCSMVEAMHPNANLRGETLLETTPLILNEAISKYTVYWGVLLASSWETDLRLWNRKWLFIAKFCTVVARYIGEVSFRPALRTRQNYFILWGSMESDEHLQGLSPEQEQNTHQL